MITCCNNAGTSCLFLSRWEDSFKFAKNALLVLDALYEKRDTSKILKLIYSHGVDASKLFGVWKVKSLLLIARALAEKHETEDAMSNLKTALGIVTIYKKESDSMCQQLALQEKQIRRLFTSCKQRIIAEKKKERQRAQAMFNSGSGKSKSMNHTETMVQPIPIETNPSQQEKEEEGKEKMNAPSSSTSHEISNEGKEDEESTVALHSPRTKRVSFADGNKPGSLLDDDEEEEEQVPSFFDEHK